MSPCHDRRVSGSPWAGDACSLVDALRAGERSPLEELDASLAAIEASDLNAFSLVDADRARSAAARADVSNEAARRLDLDGLDVYLLIERGELRAGADGLVYVPEAAIDDYRRRHAEPSRK